MNFLQFKKQTDENKIQLNEEKYENKKPFVFNMVNLLSEYYIFDFCQS